MIPNNPAVAQTKSTTPATEAPNIEAKFDQDSAHMKSKVANFIEAAGGAPAIAAEPVTIKPNDDFKIPNPSDIMMTEALIKTEDVTVSDTEKNLFVKALLNEEPVRFTIELLAGRLKVDVRSRTLHEQRSIFDVLTIDRKTNVIPPGDMAYEITRMQQYCMALMIERVNGKIYSESKVPAKATAEEAAKILHAEVDRHDVEGIVWTALLNAIGIFEAKCAKLQTEAANPDFWKPLE